MATLTQPDLVVPVTITRPRFFLNASIVCLAIGIVGFAPTYWVPLLTGRLDVAPLAHVHALVFYGWLLVFVRQSQLVSAGAIGRHRELGVAGVAIATAMFFVGLGMAVVSIRQGEAAGHGEAAHAFAIVPLTGIALFAVLFAVALRNVARPDIHKRLMFVNTAALLQAAVGRWFLLLLAPVPLGATAASLPPPPVAVSIGAALVVDLLIVWGMLHDRHSRGRVHPVYWSAGAAVLAVQLLRVPISATQAWRSVTHALLMFVP